MVAGQESKDDKCSSLAYTPFADDLLSDTPMAKKSNRPKSKAAATSAAKPPIVDTPPAGEATNTSATTTSDAPRAPRPIKQSRSQVASEQLEEQYAYITGDLRRVFILAAVMFALLIGLNIAFDLLAG